MIGKQKIENGNHIIYTKKLTLMQNTYMLMMYIIYRKITTSNFLKTQSNKNNLQLRHK